MANICNLVDPPHINIGNIQIELTADDAEGGGPGDPNGGHTRSILDQKAI
jgi:hypothetical protein